MLKVSEALVSIIGQPPLIALCEGLVGERGTGLHRSRRHRHQEHAACRDHDPYEERDLHSIQPSRLILQESG
ncbi:MAG: hypothetical protein HC938_06120 [Nitrospira sp.]|nr:hypothetical protein [Nitrospira sp.]